MKYIVKAPNDGNTTYIRPIQVEPVLKKSGVTVAQGKEEITQYITEVNESVGNEEQQEQKVIYTKYYTQQSCM